LTAARLPPRQGALVVFVVALAARLAVVAWARGRFPAVDDGTYYDVLARRLASGAGYTWLWPDGAVTYVAHYPVGYPAMVALAYRLLGAAPASAMIANALVGSLGAVAVFDFLERWRRERAADRGAWRPLAAGIAVALHPALLPYTAAIMTEGVTASLLLIAAGCASRARGAPRPAGWIVAAGVVMGAATLVRPQSLVLAPVLGLLAASPVEGTLRARLARAGAISAIALGCVVPWTTRNCERMHRCALVSVNGGWNLLIGAQTRTGSYETLEVPPECRTVWDEAAKDMCFERAARAAIADAPLAWIARAPAKLAWTFDYFGAAPWYLHDSNAQVFDQDAKVRLGAFETIVSGLLLLGALVVCGLWPGPRATPRKVLALAGAVGAGVTLHAWIAYVALIACVASVGRRAWADGPLLLPWTAATIAATAAVHAVFFGAGRYGLVVAPLVAALAFVAPGDAASQPAEA
jgi:hypothetical protein